MLKGVYFVLESPVPASFQSGEKAVPPAPGGLPPIPGSSYGPPTVTGSHANMTVQPSSTTTLVPPAASCTGGGSSSTAPCNIPKPPQIISSPPAFHLDHNTN